MKKIVIVALLIAISAGLLLIVYVAKPGKVVAPSTPASAESAKVVRQSEPVVADMSLPLPLGLKGDAAKGGIFYMENCFACHGIAGDGDGPRAYFITPPPRDFLLESSRQRLNRPALFEAISNGRFGTNMPAWKRVLSNQEMADVAEYVFQHFINAPRENKGKQK
jgi:mono/diheme cytochrome c family protein